jgi:hypothetical protein
MRRRALAGEKWELIAKGMSGVDLQWSSTLLALALTLTEVRHGGQSTGRSIFRRGLRG